MKANPRNGTPDEESPLLYADDLDIETDDASAQTSDLEADRSKNGNDANQVVGKRRAVAIAMGLWCLIFLQGL
jgi:hypothetical protein